MINRILLTHTAGFGYANADPDLNRWAKHVRREYKDVTGTLESWNLPLKFTPGQGWYYGTGIDWAGHVVEKITGQTLGEYMAAHVLRPLGMNDTTFRGHPLPHVRPERIVPTSYRNAETGELASGPELLPSSNEVHSGGAGLVTTAVDYAKLLQSLLQSLSGDGDGVLLLGKPTVDEMFRPQLTPVQHSMFKFIAGLFHQGMAPEFSPEMPLDHGISGVINLEDCAGKRRKGSMMWAGVCNGHWVSTIVLCRQADNPPRH